MIRTLGFVVCVMALVDSASAAGATPTVEDQVRLLEQDWVNAENRHDATALRRILDEKFISTSGSAPPINRDAFIQAIVSNTHTDVSQVLSEQTVIVDHDTAVVAGIDTVRGVAERTWYSHVYRYTATYIRRGGHWVALEEHIIQVPDSK